MSQTPNQQASQYQEPVTRDDVVRLAAEAVAMATGEANGRIMELSAKVEQLQMMLDDLAPAYPTDQVHYCLPAFPADECSYVLIARWDSEDGKHKIEWQKLWEFECPGVSA